MPSSVSPAQLRRVRCLLAAALPFACLVLAQLASAAPLDVDVAPAPRAAGARSSRAESAAAEVDRTIVAEIQSRNKLMKNLQYLSDVIGPRLTASKNAEKANHWTEDKMKEYGLENVHLEPWEVPIGWERGRANMKLLEPDTGRSVLIASAGWRPGTKGKVVGDVVYLKARTKEDLKAYKGKLKNAVILLSPPANVAPVTDMTYLSPAPARKKEMPKKAADAADGEKKKADLDNPTPKKAEKGDQPPAKEEAKKDFQRKGGNRGGFNALNNDVMEFLKEEDVACLATDSGKPHGLLVTTGGWPRGDRATPRSPLPQVYMAHEHYAMLYRLATRPAPAVTRVEVDIDNKFIPGPITVYNTVGEIKGSEKPDEFVIVGAHLDSWDLASGTTDNGTGSCVVLETARTLAALAEKGIKPKRTIRFVLFTGEEQGLHGSKQYTIRHKDEMAKVSVALVHDTGTGKVTGFGLQGRAAVQPVLEPELATLSKFEGWKGLDLGSMGGSDHASFEQAGVPGFACRQDTDEYRLTHHTQSDTFDKAKEPNLIEGAQAMAVTAMRVANMPEMLPRKR